MGTHRTFIATYIMANGRNSGTYVGMTANLTARVWKHKTGAYDSYSKDKGCTRLVWFERHAWVVEAIARETDQGLEARLETEADRGRQSAMAGSGCGLVSRERSRLGSACRGRLTFFFHHSGRRERSDRRPGTGWRAGARTCRGPVCVRQSPPLRCGAALFRVFAALRPE